MDLVLRRCFWMVDLGFLAAAALLCALTVGVLARRPARPPELPDLRPAFAPLPARPPLDAEAVARSTGLPLGSGDEGQPPAPTDELVPTTLNVQLLGTSVSNLPELSLATIQDKGTREAGVFAIGDSLQGATVVDIERLRVLVDNQGRREAIDLQGTVAEGPAGGQQAAAGAGSAAATRGITQVGPSSYEVERALVAELVQNPAAEMGKILLQPVSANGTTAGWKVTRLAPDALLARLGIARGDVFRRINGFEVSDPARLLELVSKRASANLAQVELDRGGTPVRLEYRIKG